MHSHLEGRSRRPHPASTATSASAAVETTCISNLQRYPDISRVIQRSPAIPQWSPAVSLPPLALNHSFAAVNWDCTSRT